MGAQAATRHFDAPAVAPLCSMMESYGQCLALTRAYNDDLRGQPEDVDLDPDGLSELVAAREELFAAAERSFRALAESEPKNKAEAEARDALSARAVALMKEMDLVERDLAAYLGDRLEKMRRTISLMGRAQPVFRRYGHLGGDKMAPNRVACGV